MTENRASPKRGRDTLLVALGASVALHAAVIALLPSRPSSPASSGEVVPFEVELRQAPAATAPAAPAAPSRNSGSSPRARPASAPRGNPTASGALRTDAPHPPAGDGSAPLGPPDLHVHWPGIASSAGGARAPRGGGELGATAPAPDPLDEWAREQAGRARVESGVVHPYYRDVGRALLGAWDAERTIQRRGISGWVAQAGDAVRTFGRVWQRVAEGFARTGQPGLIDGGSARMKELSGLPAGPARDALVAAETRRQLRPEFSKGHVAVLRVTQGADGRLISVEIVSPSSDVETDRAAVEDVRTAARNLPVPPREALAGRERLVSLWEFEIEISITPPLPVVEVEFDEVLGLKDLRLPLDRRIWKRVRLVAVI